MWRRLQQRCSFSMPGGDTVPSPDCAKLASDFLLDWPTQSRYAAGWSPGLCHDGPMSGVSH